MSVAAGAVVNIAINAFAIPIVGALGASVATVAAELAVLVLQSRAVRSDLPLGTYLRGALPFLAMGAAMYAAIRALSHAMGPHASTIPGLLAEIVCGGAIYVALSYAWCRAVRSPELKRVLPRLARW